MEYQVFVSGIAQSNIKESFNYYQLISESLAIKYSIEINQIIEKLKTNPLHFQKRYRDIRIAHTDKFPFGLHFLIEEKSVFIVKVLHHKKFYK
jgi:hypothetical protein